MKPVRSRNQAEQEGKATTEWRCGTHWFRIGERPLIMGILNVTPDSFSDGGRFMDFGVAVEHACRMAEAGADIIDVGGESSRPGSERVPLEEEIRRVIPVIGELAGRVECPISVDTMKAEVARQALEAGASIVNDISAGRWDPEMLSVVAESGAGMVLMHMQGEPRTMQQNPQYKDVVAEVVEFLAGRMAECEKAGIDPVRLAVDPGIGFGKTLEHNLQLLAALPRLRELGRPVVVGASRKSMIGMLTGREVNERLAGSLAVAAYALMRGAHVLRVHDVAQTRDVISVIAALKRQEMTGR